MGEETEIKEEDIQSMGCILDITPYIIVAWQWKLLMVLTLCWSNPGINTVVSLGWKDYNRKQHFTFKAHAAF